MNLIPPTTQVTEAARPTGRTGTGRSVALLVLVGLATLVPLLGPSLALHGTGEAAPPDADGVALLRTVLFVALCVPVGELFINGLARRCSAQDLPGSWAPYAAGVGLVAALGLASIDLEALYRPRDAVLALLAAGAFAAAGVCALSRRPVRQAWPLAVVVLAEALRAHPWTEHTPLLGSTLTVVHLTCAAMWTGGLLHVLRTLRSWAADGAAAGAALLGLYARVAALLLAGVTATGVCSSLRRMPLDTMLGHLATTAYGRVLLAKVLLVGAIALLALGARTRLRRAPDPLTACVPARVEVAVLGVVVAVSGLLTALPLPPR
ncbi:CopD family protein [Streptomyces sp. NBC_01275]|uniref:CopD family protein n=1 Tax=Streptomyces sp. NBC_01275 TaxID=2903807 RepID=UPI00225018B7|nr:CopD family protein [Streptomyces sp. NBC_01275]MCX4761001.1 CopD family protein [Streptomyces sp. NBC_01275]